MRHRCSGAGRRRLDSVLLGRLTDTREIFNIPNMSTIQEVRSKVMALSASERASLAHDLILSLDDPADYELGPAQETEIQRRLTMVREGTALGRPASEVFADIKAKYS